MKIAFLVENFPVVSETFILNQIVGLISRGHEVDIYALQIYGDNSASKSVVHPDVEKYQLLKRTHYPLQIPQNYLWRLWKGLLLILTNFTKAPLPISRSLNFCKFGKDAVSMRLLYSSIPFLGAPEYDVIHCQFGMHGIAGMKLREIGAIRGKIITSFRGFDISWYVKQHGETVYNQLFLKGDLFLANCEFFRQRAISLGCNPAKIIVHGSGIDCTKFEFRPRHAPKDGKIGIVTTGRLVEKKGIEYAIRAVAQVAKTHPNLEYKIIGDGELKASLQQLIDELNMGEKIQLVGWKNQPEIINIINQSHIFIAPSVTAKDGNQDAPVNTLKEAMAMGLPVIGTTHGGIPELVEEGISGFLVPERDANAIADKLNYLIENPQVWSKMGEAGRKCVETRYDTNQLNEELIKIYQKLSSPILDSNHPLLPSSPVTYIS